MINDAFNGEFKKQYDLLMKKHDEFLLREISKIAAAFTGAGFYVNPDMNQFAKDIAPFVVIKTTHGDYRNGLVEATVKLEASEYLKAFMKLDLFNCDDSVVCKGE